MADLKATITADTGDFDASLKNSEKVAKKFGDTVAGAAGKAAGAGDALAGAGGKVAKGFQLQKNAATQLGFQLQDVAVQAQMGTSAFTILGQQGSQVASLFGPGGALLGAVIAIASAIGGVLFKALGDASEETRNWREELDDLSESIRTAGLLRLNEILFDTQTRVSELQARYDELKDEISGGLDEGRNVALFREELEKISPELQRQKLLYEQAAVEQKKLFDAGLTGPGRAKPDNGPDDDPITGEQAVQIAQQRLAKRLALIKQFGGSETAFLAEQVGLRSELLRHAREQGLITEQEFQAFELEAEQMHFEALDAIRAEAYSKEIQQRAAVLKGLRKLELDEQMKRRQGEQTFWGNMASLANTNSRKLFEISKIAAVSNALLSARESVVDAYKWGVKIGGPPAGAAAAAAAGLATLAQVQQIQSQSFGGAGGATGTAAGGSAAGEDAAAATGNNQIVSINLEGDVFSTQQVRGLITKINEVADEGFKLRLT